MIDYFLIYKNKRIYYSIKNKGEPLFFIHGLNMDSTMLELDYFKSQTKDKMIIALDLPGYGKSETINNLNIDDIGEIISLIASECRLETFELAGFCLGGVFALDYSIRHPNRISHLHLIETMIYLPKWMNLCLHPQFSKLYSFIYKHQRFLDIFSLLPCFKGIDYKYATSSWNKVNSSYLKMMKKYENNNHLKRCQSISCHTRVIYTEYSFSKIKKTSKELKKVLPYTKKNVILNNSHFSLISK